MTSGLGSPVAWQNGMLIRRWLGTVWPGGWRHDDVRIEFGGKGHWLWVSPDFERGRSRILAMPRSVLEQVTLGTLRNELSETEWERAVEAEPVLIDRAADGALSVSPISVELDEAWHTLPDGETFVAFPSATGGVAVGGIPDPPVRYLALHGRTWSALGPENPEPASSYSLAELAPYVPDGHRPAI